MRPEAVGLVASTLTAGDRVLVTGAGGWFGLTLAALLDAAPGSALFTTRNPRSIDFGSGTVQARAWDWNTVEQFAPTVVIDCAFVLRDYVTDAGRELYVADNTELGSRLLRVAQLPSARTVVSVSSGAAVHPADASRAGLATEPYAFLKRQSELALAGLRPLVEASLFVARPWSLSGALVTRPERYAFSNLILQSRGAELSIHARHDVRRRYAGVDDFLAVCLASAHSGVEQINSGGELLEVHQLAERVASVLGSQATIVRPEPDGSAPDDYFSTDSSWTDACLALGFEPAALDDQIRAVSDWLG